MGSKKATRLLRVAFLVGAFIKEWLSTVDEVFLSNVGGVLIEMWKGIGATAGNTDDT